MGQSSMSSETPAHPSWISRFCGDQSEVEGGGWCSVKVKRQTFESGEGWMGDGWLVMVRYSKMRDERMWQGQWGAGADSSAFHLVTDWRSEADNGNNWGNFFPLSVAAEITVTAQGFKPDTDNVPLWNLIQPYGAFLSSAPLCPFSSQIKWLHRRLCIFLHKGGGKVKLFNKLYSGLTPSWITWWLPWGEGRAVMGCHYT